MGVDEQDEHAPALRGKLDAAGDLVREQSAFLFVVTGVRRLADVVQEDRQIEHRRILELS